MSKPVVTILLPTYNRAELLPQCVQSVVNQSFKDWELIILDDGSTDRTAIVAEYLVSKDPRIIYIHPTVNIGTPRRRNVGISLARADWILFIEDDITLDSDCITNLRFNISPFVGKVMPRLITNGKDDPHEPFTFNKWTGEVFNSHACCLYQKEVLKEVGEYSDAFTGNYYREETDLDCRIKKARYSFVYVPEAIMYHNPVERGSWKSISNQTYYVHRNHLVFLYRSFGWRTIYMAPCYAAVVLVRAIKRRIQ